MRHEPCSLTGACGCQAPPVESLLRFTVLFGFRALTARPWGATGRLSLSLFLSLSLSISVYLSLSLSLNQCVSVSITLFSPLFLSLSLPHSSLSPTHLLFLSPPLSFSLPLYLYVVGSVSIHHRSTIVWLAWGKTTESRSEPKGLCFTPSSPPPSQSPSTGCLTSSTSRPHVQAQQEVSRVAWAPGSFLLILLMRRQTS